MAQTGKEQFRFLKIAIAVQATLLVLCIAVMALVSIRFTTRQHVMADDLAKKQALLDDREKDLEQTSATLSRVLFNRAIELERLGQLVDAARAYADAVEFAPNDAFLWRRKVLLEIHQKHSQEALKEFQAAPLDRSNATNLLTEAILACAANQLPKAIELKKKAQAAGNLVQQDMTDLHKVCPSDL